MPASAAPIQSSWRSASAAADSLAPLLDPAKVTGKVLVCDRGNNVLVNKSANGKTAGAVGVIIANVEGGATTMLSQPHTVSTIHITKENGKIVKDYVAANRVRPTARWATCAPRSTPASRRRS
jgi:hypothetical protein